MPWFKVDDRLHSHPKVGAVLDSRPTALGLWVLAGSWCAAMLTDGRVPPGQVKRLGFAAADAATLVLAGLWHADGDGWVFHDWHEYQPTKADVLAERTATAARVERWRNGRRNDVGNGVTASVTPTVGNGVSTPAPIPSRPDPVPEEDLTPRADLDLLTWQRASRLWADALGIDATKISLAHHEPQFQAIVRLASASERELRRVLGHYVADAWVAREKPVPKHLASSWHKYLAPVPIGEGATGKRKLTREDIRRMAKENPHG